MRSLVQVSTLSLALLFSAASLASERVDHYKGISAATLPEAVANFSEYNAKLETILAQDSLSAVDLHNIHQLTYTLENALQRINQDFGALSETLEQVHLASEKADNTTVQQQGQAYLKTARQLIQ